MPSTEDPSRTPRYLQIKIALRDRILCGEIDPAQRLPGERQMAREFDVSAVTMSRALAELVREGLIVRQPGGGTYVREAGRNGNGGAVAATQTLIVDTGPIREPQGNYYMGPLLVGVQEVAMERGCPIRFVSSPETPGDGGVSVGPGEGLLVIAPLVERVPALAALARTGVPLVICGAAWPEIAAPAVDSDNRGGAAQAVEYLLRLGHRRIAFVSPPLYMRNHVDRLDSYRATLQRNGVAPSDDLVFLAADPVDFGEDAGRRLHALLISSEAPTAVFAAGYGLALAVLAAARGLGLHVPNDLSVVGFDDPFSAAHLSPPLTTVRQPLTEMGRRAAEVLVGLAGCRHGACPVEVLPCELIVRGSCLSTRHG